MWATPKKHLSFNSLRDIISDSVNQIQDNREAHKIQYSIHDACLGTLAMMHFQHPSLNSFKHIINASSIHFNNLQTLFQIESLPQATQMREILDNVAPEYLEAILPELFKPLQRGKFLESFKFLNDSYLVSIDGTEYYSSKCISCDHCLHRTSKQGITTYYHQLLPATLVCPGVRQVIPLAIESVQNNPDDGNDVQDCEFKAAGRLVQKLRSDHPKLKMIILGDGLYSKQPFIDLLKSLDFSFILVAKPGDHATLFQAIADLNQLGGISRREYQDHQNGFTHRFEWVNDVLLNESKNADFINFIEYTILDGEKVEYHNTWVTDIKVTHSNVIALARGGRARWKIENLAFNTLKNQGYHLEHSFGHGSNHLAYNMAILNFLAFFIWQILELTDYLYSNVAHFFSSRMEYRCHLRCALFFLPFLSFNSLLLFFRGLLDSS